MDERALFSAMSRWATRRFDERAVPRFRDADAAMLLASAGIAVRLVFQNTEAATPDRNRAIFRSVSGIFMQPLYSHGQRTCRLLSTFETGLVGSVGGEGRGRAVRGEPRIPLPGVSLDRMTDEVRAAGAKLPRPAVARVRVSPSDTEAVLHIPASALRAGVPRSRGRSRHYRAKRTGPQHSR